MIKINRRKSPTLIFSVGFLCVCLRLELVQSAQVYPKPDARTEGTLTQCVNQSNKTYTNLTQFSFGQRLQREKAEQLNLKMKVKQDKKGYKKFMFRCRFLARRGPEGVGSLQGSGLLPRAARVQAAEERGPVRGGRHGTQHGDRGEDLQGAEEGGGLRGRGAARVGELSQRGAAKGKTPFPKYTQSLEK